MFCDVAAPTGISRLSLHDALPILERIFKAINVVPSTEPLSQAKALFNQHYDKVMDAETKLFPHVKETLKTLHENQYPLALVTNKPAQFLPALLSSLGIKEYFSLVLGGGDVIKLKPHPAPLYQVMATFGLFSDQLLFVGDSKNDITAEIGRASCRESV